MGEPTCLMQVHHHQQQQQQQQPFSYTSGFSNSESNEGNPIHALGQSVSFGRFMSESLAWEKWSSFSHNRYVEEAERYSRPGSVAQKKAFFEAHYKNLAAKKAAEAAAAAALLEQENSAASQHESDDVGGTVNADSETAMVLNSDVVVKAKTEEEQQQNLAVDSEAKVDNGDESVLIVKETELKATERVEKSKSRRDQEQVLLQKTTSNKKKTALSSSSSSKSSSTSKPAVLSKALTKSAAINATPMSKKPALESADKKRSTPKSLHIAVNFSPIREISRLKSTVIRKIDNSRFGSSSSKPSKDCYTPLKTPVKVSKNGARQQPLETPCSANRRATTPGNPSASGSKPTGPKWRLLATDCSKILSACRNKTRSPFSSTPFSFRTEERAAKRKEKLEEKFNANEVQEEEQPKTKVKDKSETETGNLRPGFCFKARPLPDFYKQRKVQKDETKKVLVTKPQSPKPGNNKATPSKAENRSSQTPNRPPVKSNVSKHFQGKIGRSTTCSFISRPKRTTTITHENTSPNIQYR